MKEMDLKRALNAAVMGCQPSEKWKRQTLLRAGMERPAMRKRLPAAMILALLLLLLTATALAVALLTPREVVEQVAVPAAQSNGQENYTYEELAALMRSLNENGITLDEGSTLMQAFQTGHGYWERDVIEEICRATFGRDNGKWTLEQKHWYGEMMQKIGAWEPNFWLLPEEGELTEKEALALAAKTLRDAYGVELPLESGAEYQVAETFELTWREGTDPFPRDGAQWTVWYYNQKTGNLDYDVTFGRFGDGAVPWRARYLAGISRQSVFAALDDLEGREGSCTQWSVETWAEFGDAIKGMTPKTRREWLYLHAGYCLPPAGAVPPQSVLKAARESMGFSEEWTGVIQEQAICCEDGGRPIYKISQRVILDPADAGKAGRYDQVWCLEADCMTGEILDRREYVYGPRSDEMMMYAPFSLLREAPAFEEDRERAQREEAAREKETETGLDAASGYFLPLEKQAEIFGGFHTVPTREEYDQALAVARNAVARRYGEGALEALGDYQTGASHQVNGSVETGDPQHVWDFLFTTDPQYLSDGYRVQFRYPVAEQPEENTVMDLSVEHAGLGNG